MLVQQQQWTQRTAVEHDESTTTVHHAAYWLYRNTGETPSNTGTRQDVLPSIMLRMIYFVLGVYWLKYSLPQNRPANEATQIAHVNSFHFAWISYLPRRATMSLVHLSCLTFFRSFWSEMPSSGKSTMSSSASISGELMPCPANTGTA